MPEFNVQPYITTTLSNLTRLREIKDRVYPYQPISEEGIRALILEMEEIMAFYEENSLIKTDEGYGLQNHSLIREEFLRFHYEGYPLLEWLRDAVSEDVIDF